MSCYQLILVSFVINCRVVIDIEFRDDIEIIFFFFLFLFEIKVRNDMVSDLILLIGFCIIDIIIGYH